MTTDQEKAALLHSTTPGYLAAVGHSINRAAVLTDNYNTGFGSGGSNEATAAVANSIGTLKEWQEFREGVMSVFGNDAMDPPAPPTGG